MKKVKQKRFQPKWWQKYEILPMGNNDKLYKIIRYSHSTPEIGFNTSTKMKVLYKNKPKGVAEDLLFRLERSLPINHKQ